METLKRCFFFTSLVIVVGINANCTFHYSYGKIGFIGMNKSSTTREFSSESTEIIAAHLDEDGIALREYCIVGLKQTKEFLQSAAFPNETLVGFYSGRSLLNPKVLGILNRSCYAILIKESEGVSVPKN